MKKVKQPKGRISKLAIVSLICVLSSPFILVRWWIKKPLESNFGIYITLLLSGLAIILGGIACYQISKSRERVFGRTGAIVSIVLGILLVFFMINVIPKFERCKQKAIKHIAMCDINNFIYSLESYYRDFGHYPSTAEGLEALIDKESAGPSPDRCYAYKVVWGRPDMKLTTSGVSLDPWGQEYRYISDGRTYTIVSYGRDGKPGGTGAATDISSEELIKARMTRIKDYRRIIKRYPASSEAAGAQYKIGTEYNEIGKFEQALKEYQKALKNYPGKLEGGKIHHQIGSCYNFLGKYDQAFQEFRDVIKNYPNSTYVKFALERLNGIGGHYLGEENYIKVIEIYQSIVKNCPASHWADIAQLRIASAYQKLKNYNQALKEYRKLLKNYPDSKYVERAQAAIGNIFYQYLDDYDEAARAYQKLLDNYPKYYMASFVQYRIGECYRRLKKYDQAIETYQKVIKNYPKEWEAQAAKKRIEELKSR